MCTSRVSKDMLDILEELNPRKKKQLMIKARALEVIYDRHVPGSIILKQLRGKTGTCNHGLYKAYVKWHNGTTDEDEEYPEPHTHVGLILRDKPQFDISKNKHKEYFTIKILGDDGIEEQLVPRLVKPLGKGNKSPLKKLKVYCAYLTDGHDNGRFEDVWNYKYDYELESCGSFSGRVLCLMSRGEAFDDIYHGASWDDRVLLSSQKKKILTAWREYKRIIKKPIPAVLRPWQNQVVEELKLQGDRKIKWVYDPPGNGGKTFLCKELALHHDAAVFNNAGKKDLAFAYDDQPIVAFNLTRTTDGRVNYEAMESLKDGLMFSAKYESETKVFTPPSIVVMANFQPERDMMSLDRWDIQLLNPDGVLTQLP